MASQQHHSQFGYTQIGYGICHDRLVTKTHFSARSWLLRFYHFKHLNRMNPQKIARVYLRVSTNEQDLARQDGIVAEARDAGYYIAGVYREKASGARSDRPELLRMIGDLQPGEVVIAEKIDRISRLPLNEAERLIAAIQAKGARLSVPGIVDLSELAQSADGVAKIVIEAVQSMLLRLALQIARDDYETRRERQRQGVQLARHAGKYSGRRPDALMHQRILALRPMHSIKDTAKLAKCSESQVKRICALYGLSKNKKEETNA